MKTTTIKQVHHIPAKPEQVYDAYLDPKKQSEFTDAKTTCDKKVEGKFTAWNGYATGKNLVLEKDRRVVQESKTSEWPEGYEPSVLELTFKAKDGGTELAMMHSKVPAEQADDYRQGWIDYYWKPMKEYFEKK